MKPSLACFLAVLSYLAFSNAVSAQPDTLWTRTYSYPPDFFPSGILWGHDGNILVSGIMQGPNSEDAFILKLDGEGNYISLVQYGQPNMNEEVPAYVCRTSDGGYALATQTVTHASASDYYLARLDISGAVLWVRMYGVPPNDEILRAFIPTTDGGFVMAGQGHWSATPFAFRVDSNGDSLWAREYHFTPWGETRGIVETSDGGFAITGFAAENLQAPQVFFAKLDSAGNLSQLHLFGADSSDEGNDIVAVSEGGFLIAGQTDSYSDNAWDLFVLRLGDEGDSLWARIIPCGFLNEGKHCRELSDGSFMVESICFSGGTWHLSLTHLTSDGETIWQALYPVGGEFFRAGLDLAGANQYLMCAERLYDTAVIMLTEPDTTLPAASPPEIANRVSLTVSAFPNPFNAQVIITIRKDGAGPLSVKMFDVLGRTAANVLTDALVGNEYTFAYDASNLAAGIYFIWATSRGQHAVAKIVLAK